MQRELEVALESSTPEGRAHIDNIRAKINTSLFNNVPTLNQEAKDRVEAIICLFALGAYREGRRDSLEAVRRALNDHVSSAAHQNVQQEEPSSKNEEPITTA